MTLILPQERFGVLFLLAPFVVHLKILTTLTQETSLEAKARVLSLCLF